jgi:hypothetical protein
MSRIHLAPLALLVATAMAQNMNQCPNGQLSYQNNDQQWCCPGAVYGDENGTAKAFCCVGARFDVAGPSFAPCFPFCSGSDGVTVTSTVSRHPGTFSGNHRQRLTPCRRPSRLARLRSISQIRRTPAKCLLPRRAAGLCLMDGLRPLWMVPGARPVRCLLRPGIVTARAVRPGRLWLPLVRWSAPWSLQVVF